MSEGFAREELYKVLPAIGYFFTRLRQILPGVSIYGICNCDIKGAIINATVNACERVGGKPIVLKGINKVNGHPTPVGMVEIKDQVKASL
jgi:hypothetical protein